MARGRGQGKDVGSNEAKKSKIKKALQTKNGIYELDEDGDSGKCGLCDLTVPGDCAIYCDGDCRQWFHLNCVNLSKADYDGINNLSNKIKWFCNDCDGKVNLLFGSCSDVLSDISSLKDIVQQVLDVVCRLEKDNLLLKEKLNTMMNGRNNVVSETILPTWNQRNASKESTKTSVGRGRGRGISTSLDFNQIIDSHPNRLSQRHHFAYNGSGSVSNLTAREINPDYRNNQTNVFEDANEDNGTMRYRPKPNGGVIIGTKAEDGADLKLKTVEKTTWIFVSRLVPQTTKDEIVSYLKDSGVETGECVEVMKKSDNYKSFKFRILPNMVSKVLKEEFWPSGTLVKEFVPRYSTFRPRPKLVSLGNKHTD